MASEIDPVMRRFRAALDKAYGDRIERVVLFGSRARGDARPDSDYDVAIFLKDMNSFWTESGVIAGIETEILMDEGVVINALPLAEGSYRERTGFMGEVRREGIDL
jgi:predicted nucleotidyltransferase